MILKKKKGVYFFYAICFFLNSYGQKAPLTYDSYKEWPMIYSPAISSDGTFCSYVAGENLSHHLYLQRTDGSWKQAFHKGRNELFIADGKWFLFINEGDSLAMINLRDKRVEYIPDAVGYKSSSMGGINWIVCQIKGDDHTIKVFNLESLQEKRFAGVGQYWFSDDGQVLAWVSAQKGNSQLHRLDLLTQKEQSYSFKGQIKGNLVLNKDFSRTAFFVTDTIDSQPQDLLKGVTFGTDDSIHTLAAPGMKELGEFVPDAKRLTFFRFSQDGRHVYFFVKKLLPQYAANSAFTTSVKVFSGHDVSYSEDLCAVIDAATLDSKPVLLFREGEGEGHTVFNAENGDWIVRTADVEDRPIDYLSESSRPNIYLVSTHDGSRRLLARRKSINNINNIKISPDGNYIIWYDLMDRNWFAHNIRLSSTINMTSRIADRIYRADVTGLSQLSSPEGSSGWIDNGRSFLVYSHNDIWKVDRDGKKAPQNITGGYGKRHHLIFRIVSLFNILNADTILLSAFDEYTREAGFFSLTLSSGKLEKQVLSSHIYSAGGGGLSNMPYTNITRAKNANVYLFQRMSATEFPNVYSTTDFKSFVQLSNYSPEKKYNWHTTELVQWKLPNGKMDEGILYKPENFDTKKKYPLIFFYYERDVCGLNSNIKPELSRGPLEDCIPWYVSNGYLVFIPDIYYRAGHPGQSACDAVVSAAKYLSKRSYIDAGHMGLQGHSYGGFETNYIVTHSNLFAAAVSASGLTNMVQAYGEHDGSYGPHFYQTGQIRMGATLWQKPDLYIENSAVFRADHVTTPLLIMHTRDDGIFPYVQGLQWFNDLLHLHKKVWLLAYEGEYHTLDKGENQLDYTVRMQQFFDYYLKGLPPPKWMTNHVTPEMIKSGEDLKPGNSDVLP